MIRAIVVDDEVLARQRITDLLVQETDIVVVAECANGRTAVESIKTLQPDLLFLDVQMPEMGGFETLQVLHLQHNHPLPIIVFVTAYDQYALRAFEVYALDYLLKPFDKTRFQQTLQRVREQVAYRQKDIIQNRLLAFMEDLEKTYPQRLVIRAEGRVYFLPVTEITWIEAAGNYVRLHEAQASHLLRKTMKEMLTLLDPQQFLRIHRSIIVSLAYVQELQPWSRGEFVVVLKNNVRLYSSRSYRTQIEAFLKQAL